MKFKIGDKIIRNNLTNLGYSITNHDTVCEVLEIYPNSKLDLYVRVISHKKQKHHIMSTWFVESKYFKLKDEIPKTEQEVYSNFGYKVKLP